jgi:hypothetical protein
MNTKDHPLLEQAYNLCIQIESLGSSEELTKTAIMADDLMSQIDMIKGFLPLDETQS